MSIYLGQKIPFKTPFTKTNPETGLTEIVNLTGATIRYDYWYPTNATATPSGSEIGSVVSADLGTASGFIPAAENTEIGDRWRVQAIAIIGGDEWPACSLAFEVKARGEICS